MIAREFAARLVSDAQLSKAQASAEQAQRELLAELEAEENSAPVRPTPRRAGLRCARHRDRCA